jgi:hypothetical protein
MNWPNQIIVPQGWQCPCCLRVYAPTTPMCFTCGGQQTVTTGGTGDAPPIKPYTTIGS